MGGAGESFQAQRINRISEDGGNWHGYGFQGLYTKFSMTFWLMSLLSRHCRCRTSGKKNYEMPNVSLSMI